tara:strand:+ start:69 stop:368 length:300 start_codon:yes stop_codon:yes gene_type:complete
MVNNNSVYIPSNDFEVFLSNKPKKSINYKILFKLTIGLIILIIIGILFSVILNSTKITELNDKIEDENDKFEITKKDIETKFEILSKNDTKISNQLKNN